MSGSTYSVFNAMVDIITSPGKALSEVRQHTSWLWWPLLISILLASGMFIYYYSWVDYPWLVEHTIEQIPVESRAESSDAIRNFMSPGTSTWSSVAAVVIMTFIIYAIQAVYLNLANKVTSGADIGFGKWFSLTAWTSFPGIFGPIAAFVVLFMADSNQIPAESLQVLSLNSILLHAAPGEPWFTWASSLTLIHFWMIYLMGIGYAQWTGSTMAKSVIIVMIPWVLVFGIWAVMI